MKNTVYLASPSSLKTRKPSVRESRHASLTDRKPTYRENVRPTELRISKRDQATLGLINAFLSK